MGMVAVFFFIEADVVGDAEKGMIAALTLKGIYVALDVLCNAAWSTSEEPRQRSWRLDGDNGDTSGSSGLVSELSPSTKERTSPL